MKRSRAFALLLLSILFLLSTFSGAFAATEKDLEDARNNAEEARRQAEQAEDLADELREETEALDKQISSLEADVAELTPEISEATARTTRLREEIDGLREDIAQKESEIEKTQAEYERQQGLLETRMTTSYKQGALFYLDLLLNSKNFNDLIARTTLVQRVIESNQDIAIGLAGTRDSLQSAKADLDRDLDAVSTKRAEAEAVEKNLRNLQNQRQSSVNAQEAIHDKKAEMLEETEENAERFRQLEREMEQESARIDAELKNNSSSGSGDYNGVMAWPVPGFYNISSPFGPRICPFHGQEIHSGIDVARDSGTAWNAMMGASIIAAGDGTVIYTGYRGAYGNTVMIDHGNGLVTLYAHQLSGGIKVSNGQSVTKGDRIGSVGTTGSSTGYHLHFEIRVNGSPANPMAYVK